MIGKKFVIAGMTIEIISEDADKWVARNVTTQEMVFFKKTVLENAVRLGKAEQIT